ncbi:hypothetical protein [Serratia ureilytica]|uniref:hypothetical protein n=1 Tax=Serratia ureilytica TaxID=300181 RepID=UPI0019CF6FD4|nr:hypothetical protein [Serratia ureilytica]MBN5214091.1 hypothetical protein [Serratia ureilytica]
MKKPSSSTELIIGADHGESPPTNGIAQKNPKVLLVRRAEEKAVGMKNGSIDDHFLPPVIIAYGSPPAAESDPQYAKTPTEIEAQK